MPRNRSIPDDAVLAAALDLVHAEGPAALTFGRLATRVGLAGSTLVQRFGNRSQLLQRTLLHAWDVLADATARADEAAGSGPSGVVDLLVMLSGQYSEDEFADQLLVLREDLRDPVLRRRGQEWIDAVAGMVDRRLGLSGASRIGHLVVTHWQGALTIWGFTRPGPLPEVVRGVITDLLGRITPSVGRRRRSAG